MYIGEGAKCACDTTLSKRELTLIYLSKCSYRNTEYFLIQKEAQIYIYIYIVFGILKFLVFIPLPRVCVSPVIDWGRVQGEFQGSPALPVTL